MDLSFAIMFKIDTHISRTASSFSTNQFYLFFIFFIFWEPLVIEARRRDLVLHIDDDGILYVFFAIIIKLKIYFLI